jgi:hypothetical protein
LSMAIETGKRARTRKIFNDPILFEMISEESERITNVQKDGICLDISEGGLGMTAASPLKKGQVLKVFLPVRKVDTYLPIFAEVVWSQRSNGHFRIGLRVL